MIISGHLDPGYKRKLRLDMQGLKELLKEDGDIFGDRIGLPGEIRHRQIVVRPEIKGVPKRELLSSICSSPTGIKGRITAPVLSRLSLPRLKNFPSRISCRKTGKARTTVRIMVGRHPRVSAIKKDPTAICCLCGFPLASKPRSHRDIPAR